MANEAGQGCLDRSTESAGYTFVSKGAPASTDGNVTKLEVYGHSGSTDNVGFSFMTASGNDLTMVAGTEVNIANGMDSSTKCHSFVAGVDFTAFAVSTGNFLAAYTAGYAEYTASGGSDFWYISGDYLDASSQTFSLGSSYLDGLSADISAAGGLSIPNPLHRPLAGPLGGPL